MSDTMIINFVEEPIDEDEFRTKSKPGEKFRTALVERAAIDDRGSQLLTKIDVVGITHGKLAEGDIPATLIVFELRFIALNGRRFTSAQVIFKFEDPDGNMSRDPVVHAVSPAGKWAINKTEKVQNIKLGANASINAGIEAAGMGAGVVWEFEEEKGQEFYTALFGTKRIIRKGWVGEDNVAIWTVEENEDEEDGIPTFMRTAVLLSRPQDVPFIFTVKVKTEVDFIGEVKTFFGLERKDPINPVEIGSGLTLDTLDPKIHNLGDMKKLDLAKVANVAVVTLLTEEK
ncbi:hypothetical protein F4821DRAFT_264138 [Hypoxylon rubiginosum]|uniref:Uncharacterized protein n=1 Tax=Hypoxylon rubiginosum TaxID=110542 RepID=A0ACC0CNX8_9PEZI|nr:hypothetical protein F4821DRAFT_264138 [Hypoxylon rubiginosum]